MSIDNLKPHKHGGEVLKYDIGNKRVQEIIICILNNKNDASLTIAVVLGQIANRTMCCKQCMLDAALQFRDAASAIEELMELK